MRYCFFLFACFFLNLQSVSATHIIGGEMTYRCIDDKKVEVTLTVFRDCYNGVPPFDSFALMVMYDANWNFIEYLPKPNQGDDTLGVTLSNPCLTAPPDVCVHRTSYVFEVDLPSDTIAYNIVYQRCCRNRLIRNIEEPTYTGATFLVEILPKAIRACNNSPVYKQWPPVTICVNEPIDFDHGATDIDGDSIVYELCTPFQGLDTIIPYVAAQAGPYEEVVWVDPPYNLSNVLGGSPLTIDAETGFLTGIPNLIGNYVVGICAKEYRDGELISVLRRDFQYNVADCGEPTSAYLIPELQCDNLTVNFDNQSQNVQDGYQWFFDVDNDVSLQSMDFEPSFTYSDTGTYRIMLVANPGSVCSDTAYQTIILAETTIAADFDLIFQDCDSLLTIAVADFSVDSVFSIASWDWVLGGPIATSQMSTDPEPTFTVSEDGTYKLTLTVESTNGCSHTLVETFQPRFPDVASLADMVQICQGDSVALWPMADDFYTYQWTPNTAISDSSSSNPIAFPMQTMPYMLTITNPINGCTTEGMVDVSVDIPSGITPLTTADPQTVPLGQSSQLSVDVPGVGIQQVLWSPVATLDDAQSMMPVATPADSTLYFVDIIESTGCRNSDSVWVYVIKGDVCVEPFIFFPTGFSPNGDGENDALQVEGNAIEEVYWAIYDRWGKRIFEANGPMEAWDGTVDGQDVPPDTYGFYLRIRCVGGFETIRKGNVTLLR